MILASQTSRPRFRMSPVSQVQKLRQDLMSGLPVAMWARAGSACAPAGPLAPATPKALTSLRLSGRPPGPPLGDPVLSSGVTPWLQRDDWQLSWGCPPRLAFSPLHSRGQGAAGWGGWSPRVPGELILVLPAPGLLLPSPPCRCFSVAPVDQAGEEL